MKKTIELQAIVQVLNILIPLAIGMAARRTRLSEPVFEVIDRVVLWLMFPALVFSSIASRTLGIIISFGNIIVLAFLGLGACVILSVLSSTLIDLDRKTTIAIVLNASFMNVTYLGLPMVYIIMGRAGLMPATFYAMAVGILHLTFGTILSASAKKKRVNLKSVVEGVLTFPPAFALIASLIFVAFKARPPDEVFGILDYIAAPSSFLMLLLVGYQLRLVEPKKYALPLTVVGIIRFFVCPVITFVGIMLLGPGLVELRKSAMIQSSMPPAIFNLILAKKFGLDLKLYGALVFYLTFVSIFLVVPLVLTLMPF